MHWGTVPCWYVHKLRLATACSIHAKCLNSADDYIHNIHNNPVHEDTYEWIIENAQVHDVKD